MIMGVNDISQLHNEDYKTRTDICDILVKPQSNNAIRSNNDINSKRLIQKADIIIVFGMSLGATDKLWWDLIGTKITSSKSKLILFEHIDQPINFRRGHRLGIMREEVIKKFTAHLNSSDISLRKIEENTYVNFSTDFFSKSKIK